jgi:hypothetical protein
LFEVTSPSTNIYVVFLISQALGRAQEIIIQNECDIIPVFELERETYPQYYGV